MVGEKFVFAAAFRGTSRRQMRLSWLSSARWMIPHSVTQPPANSTQADSEAILPNRTQLVFLRAVFHMKYYKVTLRENGLQRPAKGGSTPAFAYQRAAIAPLPCPNLQTCFSLISQLRICKFSKKRLQQKNRLQNSICFANVGCSPTPRQHF